MANFDVCIRGDGIVARTLALHLAALRLRVACVAQRGGSEPAWADIRAYALNHAARQLLEAVRCWPAPDLATPVTSMRVWGDAGGELVFQAQDQGVEALNWIVDVPALEAQLAQAIQFQPLITYVADVPEAALTVVCEGKHSQTRHALGVVYAAQTYEQWALATRIELPDAHQQTARQWFAGDNIVALLPLGGVDGHTCALVWSTLPQRAQELQTCSAEDFCEALAHIAHLDASTIALCAPRAVWPLQHAQAQRWCGRTPAGAWVLAGDAAHAVHPLAGQGLNLGLGDVGALVDVVAHRAYWRGVGDMHLLRQYERARKSELFVMGSVNDGLQQLFTRERPGMQYARNMGMRIFNRSGALKQWVARRAMQLHTQTT